MSVEIHGWTLQADGTLWFGVMVVDGKPPELSADLVGTLWALTPTEPFIGHEET